MPVEDNFGDNFEGDVEDGFAQALRGAAALAPEVALFSLAAGAERRGRRWRSRRRAAVAGVAAVAVLAVGGVGVFVDAGPGAVLSGSAAADPAVQPMTSEEAVDLVAGLLPPGSLQTVTAETPGVPGPANNKHRTVGVLRYDDGQGASLVRYAVERGSQRPEAAAVCMDGFTMPQDSCERTTGLDGSVLVIDKLRDQNFPGKREWRATRATPDGMVIQIIEYNGEPATPTRETPPLDGGQLAAMVTSPTWGRIVAALPANPGAPKPDRSSAGAPAPAATTPAPADLLATLTKLLPPGAQASGADEQHTALTVTFEGRTSKVSIYAEPAGSRGQQDKKDAEEGLATPLEVHEKLSDGTLLVLNRFGNGKTAVDPLLHWTAKVYCPDGRNILLNEWNGENGYDYRPGDPALSVEQLKAVITAPDWRK
ncbi:hypothetical protein [Kitasatospora purpeofusca]|uniref:hypothetical protein n=1 Tax=Kitasatospora purpeofusca TaxID=67352 RepID=UPI003660AB4D